MAEITPEAVIRIVDRLEEANREVGELLQVVAERPTDSHIHRQLVSFRGRADGLREALHLALDLDPYRSIPPF